MELASFIDGKALTTTLAIAEGTNNSHEAVLKLARKHAESLERVGGRVGFEIQPFETPGGTQHREIAYLNERQATQLINLMRNTEIVITFKERLTTAFYNLAEQETVIDYKNPVFVANLITQGAIRLQELEQEKHELIAENHQLRPGAAYAAQVQAAPDSISVGETAQLIGTGRNRLMAFMRRIGWITRYNAPYQEKVEEGLLDTKQGKFQRPDNGLGQSITTRVTGKGLVAIERLWREDQMGAEAYIQQMTQPLKLTEH